MVIDAADLHFCLLLWKKLRLEINTFLVANHCLPIFLNITISLGFVIVFVLETSQITYILVAVDAMDTTVVQFLVLSSLEGSKSLLKAIGILAFEFIRFRIIINNLFFPG